MTNWTEVTWLEVMGGDTVRLPGRPDSEALVDSVSSPQRGHARMSRTYVRDDGKTGDVIEAHEHVECTVQLAGRDKKLFFAPSAAIELLMDDAFFLRRALVIARELNATPIPHDPIAEWNAG